MPATRTFPSRRSRWPLVACACGFLQASACLLLADLAPTSLTGVTIFGVVTSGSGVLAGSGSFNLVFSATGNNYQIQPVSGPVASDAGWYAYTKSSANGDEGTLALYSLSGRPAVNTVLTFAAPTSGTYNSSVGFGVYGSQTGTFRQVSPGAVTLTGPPDGSSFPNRRPQFTWVQSAPPGTWFYLWINRNGKPYVQQWLQDVTWTPTNDWASDNYTWAVQTWNSYGYGPWSAVSSFSIDSSAPSAVTLITPTSGVTVTNFSQPVFTWSNAVPDASWYYLWINFNGTPYFKEWMQSTNWTPTNGLLAGSYTWAVQAWNPDGYGPWSSVSSFTVGMNPGPVTLLTPTNGVPLPGSAQPIFSWSESKPEATWYYLWINLDGTAYVKQWLQTTNWTPSKPLPTGSYTWAVQTLNPDGYGPWSSVDSFTVGNPPGAVTLSGPSGSPDTPRPVFSWSGSTPGATWYYLWINRDGSPYVQQWMQSTSWTPTTDLSAGNYTWAVQTWNPNGYGPWSAVLSFNL